MRVLLLLALLFSVGLPRLAAASPVSAKPADDFVESCGICTHLEYTDKLYYSQWPTVRQRLLDLGIRHIRDGSANADFVGKVRDLATHGVRTIWVLDPGVGVVPTQEFWSPSTVSPRLLLVDFLKTRGLTTAISAIEVMNEIDLFYNRSWIADYTQAGYFWKAGNTNPTNHVSGDSSSALWWGRYIIAMASNTWNAVKSDPATAGITIIGPSFGGWHDKPPTGTNSLRDFVDWGCFHPYPFGGNAYSLHDSYATVFWYIGQGQQPSCNIDEWPFSFSADQPAVGGKPMAATETGWYTGTANKAVSEAAQAKYVPRLYLEYYLHGVKRCCHYELLDEGANAADSEATRGLLRNDLTPKPAYTALRNLLSLLSDRGPSFVPGALDFTLTKSMPAGYNRPQYVRSQLFQKRDQTFWLVLYHEIASSSYTTTAGADITGVSRDIAHPDVTVKLTFNTPIAEAVLYRPNGSADALTNYVKPQTLSVAVNDAPVVLQLKVDRPRLRSYLSPSDQKPRLAIEGQSGHAYYLEQSAGLGASWSTLGSYFLNSATQEVLAPASPACWRARTQ